MVNMSNTSHSSQHSPQDYFPPASFLRRFASWVYDLLTGIAIAMLCVVFGYMITGLLLYFDWISIDGYQDMADYLADGYVFQIYLLLCLTGFFCYFWVNGGQTIGMRAWRLQLLTHDNQTVSLTQAVIRFYASLAGLGNLWVLVDYKHRQSMQDHLAKTRTVVLTKAENRMVYRQLGEHKNS